MTQMTGDDLVGDHVDARRPPAQWPLRAWPRRNPSQEARLQCLLQAPPLPPSPPPPAASATAFGRAMLRQAHATGNLVQVDD